MLYKYNKAIIEYKTILYFVAVNTIQINSILFIFNRTGDSMAERTGLKKKS